MTAALALRSASNLTAATPIAPNTSVRTSVGSVSAMFALARYDKRHGVAMYSLRVENDSSVALICRIWTIAGDGVATLAYPAAFEVEPFSLKSVDVPVWPDKRNPFERAVAEVVGRDMRCVVEANAPLASKPVRRWGMTAAAACVLGGIAMLGVAGGGLAIPGVRAFVAGPAQPNVTFNLMMNPVTQHSKGAQIGTVSVNPVVAAPGQTVTVAYAASASDGYVRLQDRDGAVWAQKPFSTSGTTSFLIPPVSGSREMRVLLHVTRGKTSAESSAGLMIAGAQPAKATQGQILSSNDAGASLDSNDANGTFDVAKRRIQSGDAIDVRILSPRNGMRIALDDTQSREVTALDVGSDKDTVALRAPDVRVPSRYTVVATFTDGFGQESIVEPITVTPRK